MKIAEVWQKSYAEASQNLAELKRNTYVGRGVFSGLDDSGTYLVQGCWTMGRGDDSRNRVYARMGECVYTKAADPSKLKPDADTKNIFYNATGAVQAKDGLEWYIASNGHQTDDVIEGFSNGHSFEDVLESWTFENDAPNNTPRITTICSCVQTAPRIEMALLRKSRWSDACERQFFRYHDSVEPGFGFCLTTYSGDGKPLPSFRGEPFLIPLLGNIDSVLDIFWDALNADNRVSLAVRFISIVAGKTDHRLKNKYTVVESVQ